MIFALVSYYGSKQKIHCFSPPTIRIPQHINIIVWELLIWHYIKLLHMIHPSLEMKQFLENTIWHNSCSDCKCCEHFKAIQYLDWQNYFVLLSMSFVCKQIDAFSTGTFKIIKKCLVFLLELLNIIVVINLCLAGYNWFFALSINSWSHVALIITVYLEYTWSFNAVHAAATPPLSPACPFCKQNHITKRLNIKYLDNYSFLTLHVCIDNLTQKWSANAVIFLRTLIEVSRKMAIIMIYNACAKLFIRYTQTFYKHLQNEVGSWEDERFKCR